MNFREKVILIVKQIPKGKVATYGQIAALAGNIRAARQVGFALRTLGLGEQDIPWWRVINKQGYISIDHGQAGFEKDLQKDLLLTEGIKVDDRYIVNLHSYLWGEGVDLLEFKNDWM